MRIDKWWRKKHGCHYRAVVEVRDRKMESDFCRPQTPFQQRFLTNLFRLRWQGCYEEKTTTAGILVVKYARYCVNTSLSHDTRRTGAIPPIIRVRFFFVLFFLFGTAAALHMPCLEYAAPLVYYLFLIASLP